MVCRERAGPITCAGFAGPGATTAYAAHVGRHPRSTDSRRHVDVRALRTATDLVVVPKMPGLMFATLANNGIWRSTNGGTSWTMLGGGAPPDRRSATARSPRSASCRSGGRGCTPAFNTRIWRSQNGGDGPKSRRPSRSRTRAGSGDLDLPLTTATPCSTATSVGLCARPTAARTGRRSPHLHADYHVFGWDTNGDGVWAATMAAGRTLLDRGATWSSSSNVMPVSQFYDVDCTHDGAGTFIGGTQGQQRALHERQLACLDRPRGRLDGRRCHRACRSTPTTRTACGR